MEYITGSPASQGFYFPPEWHPHRATWLSWPHKEASWPGKLASIYAPYSAFVKEISKGEQVCINVNDAAMQNFAEETLLKNQVDLTKISFFQNPTNDAWCRDHGPSFLINRNKPSNKVLVSWLYNAWGNKYPPYDLDILIPGKIGKTLGLDVVYPNIVMEGGSVDFNGEGAVLTTTACLLNPNRNPDLNQGEIENYLMNYYGINQVLWLEEGIVGDDTDGHIDDITRFVGPNQVITMVEENKRDDNYLPLKKNLDNLRTMRLADGKQLDIIEIPMPSAQYHEGVRLPASYANFYIANQSVIVPIFNDGNDDKALVSLANVFPDREIIGINSVDIIWGLGSFHCLSQQEPL